MFCILHIGNVISQERVIPLTSEALKTCHEKQKLRASEIKRTSKYDAIKLPDTLDEEYGYHPSCYRFYTSIRSKQQTTAVESEHKNLLHSLYHS